MNSPLKSIKTREKFIFENPPNEEYYLGIGGT